MALRHLTAHQSAVRPKNVQTRRSTTCAALPRDVPAMFLAAAVLTTSSVLIAAPAATATGLESVDLSSTLRSLESSLPEDFKGGAAKQAAKLSAVDEAFENSETLKRLRQQSEENRVRNKKSIADKYCYRQAEMGVGDCGGLRFIPGMTDAGKQRTPDWLSDLLGVERAPAEDGSALTLKKLLGEAAAQ
ncbi:hypothetical protein V8C86DRAFT_2707635 [Haematococcus lacustris]|nr:hypothetical protein QJQ45_028670 [Haematococcus lacustris]